MQIAGAISALLLIFAAPALAFAQAPPRLAEDSVLPAGLERWGEMLGLITERLTRQNGVYRVPTAADEIEAAQARVSGERADFIAAIDGMRTIVQNDPETTLELRTLQLQTLDRLDALALTSEAARLEAIAGEVELSESNHWVTMATLREVDLLQAASFESFEPYTEPGSFLQVWNAAFALSKRYEALDRAVRMAIARPDLMGEPQTWARADLEVLQADLRTLEAGFLSVHDLPAGLGAAYAAEVARFGVAMEETSTRWPDLTARPDAEETQTLIERLAQVTESQQQEPWL